MPTVSFPPSITLNSPKSSAGNNSDEDEVEESVEDDLEMASSNTLLGGGSNSMARRGSEKLGTGGGSHPFKALTAKRIAAGAAVILFLIFYFGRSTGVVRSITTPTGSGKDLLIIPAENEAPLAPTLPPSSPQRQKGVGEKKKCTPPPGKKALSYALMVDAGSTGSRLHLYTFSHCDPSPDALPKLEDEGFFTTKPGLSSYAGRPKEAAESLRGLMDHALEGIDPSERACTPIAVKATAGLRMLGEEESGAILKAVESWLRQEFPFQLIDDGVVIMDGRDEGVYAWITINYLLGLIGPSNADPTSSAAIMDLGGASTQIVFEPTFAPSSLVKLAPGDHVYDLEFAGTKHVLYQHSHLGYGLMQARRAVHNLVAFWHVWGSAPKGKVIEWETLSKKDRIHNPCMHKGETKVVTLDPPGRTEVEITMVGTGGGFEACRRVVEVMLAKDAVCEKEPCAFAGVYQPNLKEVFGAGKVWALSYFYDRIAPLGLKSPFSITDLRHLAHDVCAGPDSSEWSRFKSNKEAHAELSDRPEYCLDLTFMYSLLSLGYELEDEREVFMGKKVGEVELGWALGAAIAMMDGNLKCRVS